MKPRNLRIKGLNSFKEEQKIDFTKLTDKGLFGIFGPTGSGKSSILDAITYGLYGKIIRDNSGFINITEESVEVSYEFEIGVGNKRKVYVIDRSAKRDKKGRYKTTVVRLIEKAEEHVQIIGEGTREVDGYIKDLIGLTLDDFTRAVVLPQGKFSEFLKIEPSKRRDMLERIFGLEKYGRSLGSKIKLVNIENKEKLSVLEGKLSQFEGISEELVIDTKLQVDNLKKEEEVLNNKKNIFEKEYEKYSVIWQLQQELKVYKEKYSNLLEESSNIELKKEKLNKGKNALIVKPVIDDINETTEKINLNDKELTNLGISIDDISNDLNKIEEKYLKALKKKNNDIPILVEKETNLKQAIEIKKSLETYEKEIVILRENYNKTRSKINSIETNLKGVLSDREKKTSELKSIEERIKNIKIQPEYREKVHYGYNIEKDYERKIKVLNDLKKKIEKSKVDIELSNEKYNLVLSEQKNNIEKIIKAKAEQENLADSCPGDNNVLLEKQEELYKVREKYKEINENIIKKVEIENALKYVANKKEDITKKIIINNEELNDLNEKIKSITDKIKKIELKNLAAILSNELVDGEPCPVCGSVHHVKVTLDVDENIANDELKKKEKVQQSIEELNNQIQKYNVSLAEINVEYGHKKSEMDKILEKLKGVDIAKLEEDVLQKDKEIKKLKSEIEKWNSEKIKNEKLITEFIEQKGKIDSEMAKLKERINRNENIGKDLESEYDLEIKELDKLKKDYNRIKDELSINNIAEKEEEIKKMDIENHGLQKKEMEYRDVINLLDKKKEKLQNDKNILMNEISKIKQSGEERHRFIEEKNNQVKKLSYGVDPYEHIDAVKKEIKYINDNESILKNKLDKNKDLKQKMEQKKASLNRNKETLSELYETQIKKLDKLMKEHGFKDNDEALKSFISTDTIKSLENCIRIYEEQTSNYKNNIKVILDKLNGDSIDDIQWLKLKESRKENEKLLNEKFKEIIKKEKELNDMEEKLLKAKELLKERKKLEHKESLLKQLEKLVQGNKMVEFVAMGQLKYVAAEASKRLKDISNGKYALELDESGNFIMRDDFNGGIRRATNSLSGGETFLTSLSLALALSSQIQLKGKSPLEFFFLDEGFGTLDSELLDTVMNSLEKIRSDKMCVGIISHVDELKNRVPVKVIVEPAKVGEGSKIKIENS